MRKIIFYGCTLLVLFFVSGCGQNEQKTNSDPANQQKDAEKESFSNDKEKGQEGEFPRTVDVYGEEITIEKKPEKVAALSLNVAEIAVDLLGAEHIAAITTSAENDRLSHITEELDQIPHKIAGATSLDPEVVLSYEPDLVLLTLTHGSEQDANKMLQSAGVPLASFDRWMTVESLMENYQLIGELVGEEAKAEKRVAEMKAKVEKVQKQVADQKEKPSVLLLSQVGSNTGPYILGPSSIAYDIVKLAGGTPASDVLNLDKTTPASIEHMIEIDPDYIVLVEWGSTSGEFSELLDSPGFNTLRAVESGNVKNIPAKSISQPNAYVVDILEELAEWIHPNQ